MISTSSNIEEESDDDGEEDEEHGEPTSGNAVTDEDATQRQLLQHDSDAEAITGVKGLSLEREDSDDKKV
jgi:hypothetical protein